MIKILSQKINMVYSKKDIGRTDICFVIAKKNTKQKGKLVIRMERMSYVQTLKNKVFFLK